MFNLLLSILAIISVVNTQTIDYADTTDPQEKSLLASRDFLRSLFLLRGVNVSYYQAKRLGEPSLMYLVQIVGTLLWST